MSLILAISLLNLLRGYQEIKGVSGEPMGTPAVDGTYMSRTNLGLEYYRERIVVWLELGLGLGLEFVLGLAVRVGLGVGLGVGVEVWGRFTVTFWELI